jgi:hypothetical protein
MSNPIRTRINALDLDCFELFLDSNDLGMTQIGFYEYKVPNYIAVDPQDRLQNMIVFDLYNATEKETATVLTLKYGSIEKAYRNFRDDLEKSVLTSTMA